MDKPLSKHTGPKRTIYQMDADLLIISELILKGNTVREIADKINKLRKGEYELSYVQVHKDIQKLRKEWAKNTKQNMETLFAEHLARIDHLMATNWEAFDKSRLRTKKKMIEATSKLPVNGINGQSSTIAQGRGSIEMYKYYEEEEGAGNPVYLAQIRELLRDQAELLGLVDVRKKQNNENDEALHNSNAFPDSGHATATEIDLLIRLQAEIERQKK